MPKHSSFKFSSETVFQQAIANLLRKIPGISNVEITHGAQEYGKDIVFSSKEVLSENVCACVIKNKKITGKVTGSASAREVLFQIEQAFDTPFIGRDGSERFVDQVFVISPFDIAQTTLRSISGKLQTTKRSVEFIGGSRLIELIEVYWPDFLVDEHKAISDYFGRIREDTKNREIIGLHNIFGLEPATSVREIYVTRRLEREIISHSLTGISKLNIDTNLEGKVSIRSLRLLKRQLEEANDFMCHIEKWGIFNSGRLFAASKDEIFSLIDDQILDTYQAKKLLRKNTEAKQSLVIDKGILVKMQSYLFSANNIIAECAEVINPFEANDLDKKNTFDVESISDTQTINLLKIDDCITNYGRHLTIGSIVGNIDVDEKYIRDSDVDLVVTGDAGLGKTSFCRRNALKDIKAFMSGTSNILPIYIPLHGLNDQQIDNYDLTFFNSLKMASMLDEKQVNSETIFRLYLDGLDEVASDWKRKKIINLALLKEKPSQIIITTRRHVVAPWLSRLPRLYISPLTVDKSSELIDFWVDKKNDNLEFKKQIRVSNTESILSVPLLCVLTILVFKKTNNIPKGKLKLYEAIIYLLAGGWNLTKSVKKQTLFGSEIKTTLLSSLAYRLHKSEERYFDSGLLEKVFSEFFSRKARVDRRKLLEDILGDGIISKTGEHFVFSHFSFQEYLASLYILDSTDGPSRVQLYADVFRCNDWWYGVFDFVIGSEQEKPEHLLKLFFKYALEGNLTRINADRIFGIYRPYLLGWNPMEIAVKLNGAFYITAEEGDNYLKHYGISDSEVPKLPDVLYLRESEGRKYYRIKR